ncbi:FliG C-terminal domain-containing protein [Schlesneria paludicola]|uniref:FliG C-terminal domain-containing protein n=1 Tax=Schlesneria paludicola TaxID=360056 RepID=UPI00029A40F7|nr:FliG C-terminal domain-containing protein [Schlesneria paludicola]
MDVLPRITAQFFELFRSMSPMRRVASIAISLAVVVGFGALLLSNSRASYQPVSFGRAFVGDELPAAEQALKAAGFVDIRRDGSRLLIPARDLERGNAALLAVNALPADFGSQMLKHFETLGPFSTDRQRQQMKEALLIQELRSTIKQIPGIDDARVAIAYSDRRHGWNQKPRTTANVTLKSASGYEITASLVDSLRHVVANMVPDLKPVDVTVFDVARGHAYHGDRMGEPSTNGSLPANETLIAQYEQQLLKALSYIPNVSVAVQFDKDTESRVATTTNFQSDERAEFDSVANRPAVIMQPDSHSAAFRGTSTALPSSGAPLPSSDALRTTGLRVSVSIPRDYLRAVAASRSSKSRSAAADSESYMMEDEVAATVERVVRRLIPSTSSHDAISVTFVDRISADRNSDGPQLNWNQTIEHARRWQKEISYVGVVCLAFTLIWLFRRPAKQAEGTSDMTFPTEFEEPGPSIAIAEEVEIPRPTVPVVDRVALLRDDVRALIGSDTIAAATVVGQTLSEVGSVASYSETDGDRQAAILLLSLDQSLASELLGKLTREKVEQITFAIAKADNITRDEQERVLSSFQTSFLSRPLVQPAGPETARILLERTLERDDVEPALVKVEAQVAAGPFAFLHHRHADEIRQLIQDEHPQTIALVTSQLSPPLAAQVLSGFSAEAQADLLGRVSRLAATDLDVLADIAALLHDRLGRIPVHTGGVARAAKMLSAADSSSAASLMRTIETRDSTVADALKDELFSFSDLALIDDATLRLVMQRTGQFRWAVALKGVSTGLRQRIFSCVASPLAMALKREINAMGPLPLSEITVVQRQIAAAIRGLAIEEEIPLSGLASRRGGRASNATVTSRDTVRPAQRTA